MKGMKLRLSQIIIFLLVSALQLAAAPARKGVYTYTQPDGSSFQAVLSGDEFCRSLKTLDGCVLTYDKSGYYCYAALDTEGRVRSSGVHVSRKNSTSEAAVRSRTITPNNLRRAGEIRRAETIKIRAASVSPKAEASKETRANLIILAQFSDLKFKYSRNDFVNMLTGSNYSYNGANGSALEYFNDQFEGKFEFKFVISPVVTLSKGYAYYGENDDEGNDGRAADMVAEACRIAAGSVDFSQFDGDNDGEVDNVFVFIPGISEAEGASADHIWPHQWYLEEGAGISLVINGKKVNSYATATEITHDMNTWDTMFATIGTFCHEYSHSLGLADHYDTDDEDSGGESDCLWGSTDLMDYGNYNNNGNTPPNYNAVELETFGIGTEDFIKDGEYSLAPLGESKHYLRADTDKKGEYFIFECRAASGWDKYAGGSGMLIYHVDRSSNPAGYSDYVKANLTAEERWWHNQVNCNPVHQCLDLIEAVPIAKDVAQVFWPNGTHTSFTPVTKPAFEYWSGGTPEVSIIDIRKSGNGVTFTAAGPLSLEKVEEFQDAAIVLWTSIGDSEGKSTISIKDPTGSTRSYVVSPYSDGRFSYTFEGLKPKTTYKVTITSGNSSVISTEFTTKAYYSDGYPFIYLNSAKRNTDGSFVKGSTMPLRVFNAQNAAKVTWEYSKTTLSTDGSGYFTVNGSGTIKAIVDYMDGNREIISKTITVK